MESNAINNARMYMQTAYTDYLLNRQLSEDPDLDFTCAKKRHELLKDLYHQFFRKDLNPNPDVSPSLSKIFETLNKIDDFRNLRASTTGDKNASYIAACKFEEEMKRLLLEIEAKEHKDFDMEDDLGEYIDAHQDGFRFRMRQITKNAAEEVDMQQAIEGLGIGKEDKPGESFKASINMKKMSKKLLANPNHARIMQLLGRFKRVADSTMRTKSEGQEELVGITMGNDLDNILPEEIAEFMDPDTEVAFLDKYSNGNLLQYDTSAKNPEGKGDMIIVLDESGSMVEGKIDLNPTCSFLEVSRAILFGLATIAKKDNRRLRVIRFDGGAVEQKFDTMDDVMMFALDGPVKYGGTSYDNMLSRLMLVMGEERKKKSDVIIVSDGESTITKDYLDAYTKMKEEIGFKTLSIMIGSCGYELGRISDVVFNNVSGEQLHPDSPVMKSVFGV